MIEVLNFCLSFYGSYLLGRGREVDTSTTTCLTSRLLLPKRLLECAVGIREGCGYGFPHPRAATALPSPPSLFTSPATPFTLDSY